LDQTVSRRVKSSTLLPFLYSFSTSTRPPIIFWPNFVLHSDGASLQPQALMPVPQSINRFIIAALYSLTRNAQPSNCVGISAADPTIPTGTEGIIVLRVYGSYGSYKLLRTVFYGCHHCIYIVGLCPTRKSPRSILNAFIYAAQLHFQHLGRAMLC
jgi:hypothetical protein